MKMIYMKYLIIGVLFLSVNLCFSQDKDTTKLIKAVSNPLQESINKYEKDIENYYELYQKSRNIPQNYKNYKDVILAENNLLYNRYSNVINEIIKLQKKNLDNSNNKNLDLKLIEQINVLNSRIIYINDSISKNIKRLQRIEKNIKLFAKLDQAHNRYEVARSSLVKNSESITGEFNFTYKNEIYYGFVADLSIHTIRNYLNGPQNIPFNSINNLKGYLEKVKNTEVLMITNGGMYHQNLKPVGLFIQNSTQTNKIDLSGPGKLNFYLLPNGVFYINDNKPYIMESKAFYKLYKEKQILPTIATQSGPMLVIDGKHHPAFNHGSKSKKLRSGVGIMPNGKVVFIISKNHNTNFFDFATIFKDVFSCENALFLDGEISKMYRKSSNKIINGHFGPLIAITRK